ncbi:MULTISPECIES: hypothetical protein [Streptomyces]|uniref:Secreted protein n=1 Tax=Streptomyces griseus subsp. griseus (strain JCM 4626 / CBS 651.72 / NBRC 13350 / KCC S-0626 / ISP 5235) TaxID=455632 RepID=B1VQD5_STRGG|nr:hypothetical protein [Streptomyces griseus]MBW3703119.1 hypothetical protein [Streptomyces griseus]BAG17236.1 hypothetical protein SGR_407 [Streptomyces griseus subsp. griseus NBRC 13350]SED78327.1 hypothetical protein SAMN04490359_1869 [Streptomyces griseus]SQA20986.1 Uncharacterised protein [Streptomyces griseus]
MHVRTSAPSRRPGQAVLLVLGLLAALLAAAVPVAGPAHAAVPDRWGFSYLDNATPPPGYVPDPSRQYGSWASPSTNPVKVDQIGLGSYVVHFPLIGGPGGIAHATAVSSSARWCQIADWKPVGSGQDVYVTCYLPSGAPANSTFTVLYTSSSGLPTTPTGSYGYVNADSSGAILAQYNSTGAANAVSKGSTGLWKAWLPGLGQATHAGNLQATAVDPKQGARCKVSDWAPGTAGQTVVVACYNASDVPYDTEWTLSYSYQRAVHGPAFPPRSFGYLWYNGSLPALTNYNSSGATNTLGGSGAPFVVSLPSIAVPSDTAQVTAYGKSPEYCGLHTPWDRAGGTVRLYVACFGPGGAPVKTPFFAAYTSAR